MTKETREEIYHRARLRTPPIWKLGGVVPHGWRIPEGVSHSFNIGWVAHLACTGKTKAALECLERYRELKGLPLEIAYAGTTGKVKKVKPKAKTLITGSIY